ncbi:MAG: ribbon-helix-helix protein, CopG family [Drouetiella hepatica Uher 2000/2452]|jgi:hypothetical protein|uniref:Ribbon-helix-helix protein, CopG family n=1 Tax=Drouetiella hepatica Uher 2000/2452 TaxID=904376 RepID=A0A951QI10_9CYAN|nr:ribbon-helix-helix protein, CopG family [Drouetiella hepatica Uher 2000/2452]
MSDYEGIFQAAKQQPSDTSENLPKPSRRARKAIVLDDLIEGKGDSVRLNLDISEEMDKALKAKAKRLKITKSALVRQLIGIYLENTD